MPSLDELFVNNRNWAAAEKLKTPDFFERLTQLQTPEFLWIGCSDSRVPANQIVGLAPGELFVHRNVANVAVHTDLNCLSVVQFAVDVLHVKHIIVCGHYGCGGVKAVLDDARLGLSDNWLRHVHDVARGHQAEMSTVTSYQDRFDLLCELNVIDQVRNVAQSTVVQDAWTDGYTLAVHGLIYGIEDGLLRDLGIHVTAAGQLERAYAEAVKGRVDSRRR
jgi:carbonic anhydrase